MAFNPAVQMDGEHVKQCESLCECERPHVKQCEPSKGNGWPHVKQCGPDDRERGNDFFSRAKDRRYAAPTPPTAAESEAPTPAHSTTREKAESLAQRKMLGWILGTVERAHANVRRWGREEGSEPTAALLVKVALINTALIPWTQAVGRISTHSALNKLREVGEPLSEPVKGEAWVYARANMQNHNFYLGETCDWPRRVRDHARATYRHSLGCPNPCKRCGDHVKYRRHRVASPDRWIMIPLRRCQSKAEALRVEDTLIKGLKPQVNARPRPYWLLKPTYANDIRDRPKERKGRVPPNWRERSVQGRRSRDMESEERPLLTTYTTMKDSKEYYDLYQLCEANAGKEVQVRIERGDLDATKKTAINADFGDSMVRVEGVPGSRVLLRYHDFTRGREHGNNNASLSAEHNTGFHVHTSTNPTKFYVIWISVEKKRWSDAVKSVFIEIEDARRMPDG